MLINCPECKKHFNAEKAEKERFLFEGKEPFWLTYVDCPECKKRIFCQIDNAQTNGILIESTKLLARILRYKKNNEVIPKKVRAKYDKYSGELKAIRNSLVKRYNNGWFEDEHKHTWKVRFYRNG